MVRLPLRTPEAPGVKVTLIAQLKPAPTEPPQLLVCPKSPAFVPVKAILVIDKVEPPVLVRVTVCGALGVPTGRPANVRLPGAKPTPGTVPVPVTATDC